MSDGRPSFDEIYMDLAQSLARRSTCARARVGCVVVSGDNHQVLSVGYNGNAKGFPNECDSEEPGNCGCIHAEQNLLVKMDYNAPVWKKLYVTQAPCKMCAKLLVNAGVDEVVYDQEYRLPDGPKILRLHGIVVRKIGEDIPAAGDS